MKKIVLMLIFMISSIIVNATHMMGGDISYECISPGKYKLFIKIYRDCRGIPFNNPTISAYCVNGSGGITNNTPITYTRTAINDITPTCTAGTAPCNPENTTVSSEGIEEHVFEAIMDFNTSPFKALKDAGCCEIRIKVEQCCRNNAITTINPGNFFTDAMINICNIAKTKKKCNTSPQLSIPPVAYLCCNQPFRYNNGVREVTDGDSLSYELATPLSTHNTNENYSGGFNSQIPMTPFCPPNPGIINCRPLPNANPPRGTYFDKETGDIVFTPTKCDEVGVIVIQINEWRKDSATNKWILIGFTRRDMQLVVKQCPDNNPPSFPNPRNKYSVCEGDRICFKIQSKDDPFLPNQTRADTTTLTWNNGIPGASFSILNLRVREREAEFCWTTKIGDARPNPYSFTVTVKDDNCPKPASANRGYNVTVAPRAVDTRKYTVLDCGKLKFTATPKDTVNYNPKNYRYKYTVRDSTNSGIPLLMTFNRSDSFKFKRGGKYIIEHEINNPPFNCPTIYLDTVVMPPVLDVELSFGKDTFVCEGNSLTISPIVAFGFSPYKFRWEVPVGIHNSKDTLNKITITPTQTTRISLRLTDKNKCVDADTMVIKYIKNPIVNLGPDRRICTYDFVTLDAQNDDSLIYEWSTQENIREIKINVAGKYSVKVLDSIYKCFDADTMELFVNDTVIAISDDREICINDTLKVTAKRKPLGYSRQITWKDLNTGNIVSNDSSFRVRITSIATRKYEMFLRVNQKGVICEDLDTFTLTVNPLPIFTPTILPPRCYQDGAINLNLANFATANNKTIPADSIRFFQTKTPSWITGGPVGRNTFVWNFPIYITNAQVPKAGLTDVISYDYRDRKGCYNRGSHSIRLNPNPVVKLRERSFCQKPYLPTNGSGNTSGSQYGESLVDLSVLIVSPFSRIGGIETFRCLSVPDGSGVNPDNIIFWDNSIPAKSLFDPGSPDEPQKTGKYKIEYCFQDAVSGCKSCDSVIINVIKLPEIQFEFIPSQCINFPELDLNKYAKDRNTDKFLVDGIWSTVEFRNSRDKSNPTIANALNNSIKLNRFNPSIAGAGQYLIKLSDNSSGCLVEDSIEVVVNGLPIVRIDLPDTICSSLSTLELTSIQPGGNVGKWSGEGVVGNEFDPSISPKSKQYEGKYRVKFEYTNPITKCTDTTADLILIQTQPQIDILNSNPYQQCEDKQFILNGDKKWVKDIIWKTNGDGTFVRQGNDLNQLYNYGIGDTLLDIRNGRVLITLESVEEGVCPIIKDDIQLIIEPFPQFNFVGNPLIQCEPGEVDFTSIVRKPLSNIKYEWSFGNNSTSTIVNPIDIKYDTANRNWYDVTLIVTNDWGGGVCQSELIKEDYIKILPVPDAQFINEPNFTTVAFPKFKFINQTKIRWGLDSVKYLWSFNFPNIEDTSTQINPVKNYKADTAKYWVNLISSFTYEDVTCLDSTSNILTIGPDVIVFAPTAFSPEKTGPDKNNKFYITVSGEKTFEAMLFNRWGEILWKTKDKNEGWDGTYKKEESQQDVYVWRVKVSAYDGKIYYYEGTVTLLR
jgi:gliding motility-associated-like protein